MRRVLTVALLGCAVLFAVWWSRAPESTSIALEGPTPREAVAVVEPELFASDPEEPRGVADVAEPAVTPIDPFVPTIEGATDGSGLRLFGTVRPDGVALAPIEVSCTNGLGFQRGLRVDKRSQYSFEGLAPGLYWIHAGDESTGIGRARVDLHTDRRVDLALERPWKLTVRVTDEHGAGWDPPGVAVIATESEPPRRVEARSRSSLAVVRRPGLAPAEVASPVFATLVFNSRSHAYVSLVQHETVVATRFVGPTETEVVFQVARDALGPSHGTVRFQLVDVVTRSPILRANVQLSGEFMSILSCPEGAGEATLSPGPWTLRFHSPAFGALERAFRIEPGVALDLGDLLVGRGLAIRGRVVDAEGRGHGAFLACDPCDEHGVAVRQGVFAKSFVSTSSDGSFELTGVPPGHHRLEASGNRRQPSRADRGDTLGVDTDFDFDPALCVRVIALRTEDANGVVLTMRPGVALVVRPCGREKAGAGLRVLTSEGIVLVSRGLSPFEPERLWLAPGSYDVETWTEPDGPRERTPIEVLRERVVVDVR